MEKLTVQGIDVSVKKVKDEDYISLTDIARSRESEFPSDVIGNWMRTKNTVRFLGVWEKLYNPNFNSLEFEGVDKNAGDNGFVLTPKRWIETTGAIGIKSSMGRYADTLAHKDIAFKFASWLSVEFELYLIKEFQRLKEVEQKLVGWSAKRELARINYRIHTDAIKENLIPSELTQKECGIIYADEADILNMALFHKTAKQWREQNPDEKGNIRDYASIEQLLVLANLESLNAEFIRMGLDAAERLKKLNAAAINQMKSLINQGVPERIGNWTEQSLLLSGKNKNSKGVK